MSPESRQKLIDPEVLIATQRERVQSHTKTGSDDISPFLAAIEFLEELPPIAPCDSRVLLSVDIAEGLGLAERPSLCIRAFKAALPSGGKVTDVRLERRWHSNMGGAELYTGNVGVAVKHLAIAFEMATQHGDHLGLAGTWIPLSALASGAGQYEDAISYSDMVLRHFELAGANLSGGYFPRLPISAHFNRGNAHFRLGRLEQASHDLARVVALCGNRCDPWFLGVHIGALCVLAEALILQGKTSEAGTLLENAKDLAPPDSPSPASLLSIRRVEGQLLVWSGSGQAGLGMLEDVLAHAEREFRPASNDGELVDVLYALERSYRKLNDSERANEILSQIGDQLKRVCEKTFQTAAAQAILPGGRDLNSALEGLEEFISRKQRMDAAASVTVTASMDALQHLVALGGAACAIEEASGEHCVRVARLCREVALQLGNDSELVQIVEWAGLVHDAGKAGVPASVLAKTSSLTAHEESLMRDHAAYGAQLIERTTLPWRSRIAEAVRLHHFSFEEYAHLGTFRGQGLPIEAGILAACDRFDALTSGRPRSPAISIDAALQALFQQSGRDFDPIVVEHLIEVVRQIRRKQSDVLGYLASDAPMFNYIAARRVVHRAAT